MPRPIVGHRTDSVLAQDVGHRTAAAPSGGRLLTAPRSQRYLAAVARMDSSTTLSAADLAEVADAIHREFADTWSIVPEGFVGHCYLGAPYEAHTLTIDGRIIEHYRGGQPLPGRLEQARSLARTEHYLMIEVYRDRLVCVRADGSVVTVGG